METKIGALRVHYNAWHPFPHFNFHLPISIHLGFLFFIDEPYRVCCDGSRSQQPSAASIFDIGVECFEFQACLVDLELPIDATLLLIGALRPGFGF